MADAKKKARRKQAPLPTRFMTARGKKLHATKKRKEAAARLAARLGTAGGD